MRSGYVLAPEAALDLFFLPPASCPLPPRPKRNYFTDKKLDNLIDALG